MLDLPRFVACSQLSRRLNVRAKTITYAVATVLMVAPAFGQHVAMKEERPGLLKKAKITADAATVTAQAKVPQGTIVSAEIEEEGGKLIYSFDIKTAGKTGIDEVNVDAISGKVLGVQHETPRDEAKERAADKKK